MDEKTTEEEIAKSAEKAADGAVEEVVDEVSESADDVADKALETVEELATAGVAGALKTPANQKTNKHILAKNKLAEAEQRIKSTDDEIEECLGKIESDLNAYKETEHYFVEHALKVSQGFLKDLGVADRILESAPEPKVDLQDPEAKAVEIKPISSGRFKGFAFGLIGGIAALGTWCYSSITALGLPLMPDKFPDIERLTKVLELTSQKLGQGTNAALGGTVVVLAFLLIVWFIYWLTKTLTASSNLKTANRIEEETEFYCNKKVNAKRRWKR